MNNLRIFSPYYIFSHRPINAEVTDDNKMAAERRKPTTSTSEEKPLDSDKQFLGKYMYNNMHIYIGVNCLDSALH